MQFEQWWYNIGSGITPRPEEDQETHARRVAKAAWDAVVDLAVVIGKTEADLDVTQSLECLR